MSDKNKTAELRLIVGELSEGGLASDTSNKTSASEASGNPPEVVVLLRRTLKLLLTQLALKSETPSADLDRMLQEVIQELFDESKQALEEVRNGDRPPLLKLLPSEG